MKKRSDQKRIMTGGILTVICIVLCFAGVWVCVHTGRSGKRSAPNAYGDVAGQDSVSGKEEGNPESMTPDTVTRTMDRILLWQCEEYGVSDVQELLDTAYAERATNGTVQTYVLGLYGYKQDYDYLSYRLGLQKGLIEDEVGAMSLQKSAMLLSAFQADNPISVDLLRETIGEQGVMSDLYGLLMLNGLTAEGAAPTEDALVQEILSKQLSDGGFAIAGEEGDVDVTAIALQALAPYYRNALTDESGPSETDCHSQTVQTGMKRDARIMQAVEDALAFLSQKQQADGGFASREIPNAESTAQVILALCALERNVWTDEAFIKEGATLLDGLSRYQNTDGGFSHTVGTASNDMASSQVFAALSAVNRSMRGECFLFDFAGYERNAVGEQNLTERDDDEAAEQERMTQNASEHENTTDHDKEPEMSGRGIALRYGTDMRAGLIMMILAADCGYLAYLCLSNQYSRKRLGGVVLVSAVLSAAIWFFRIQTREEYLRQDSGRDGEKNITVLMEIRCDTVAGAEDYLPQNGVILSKTPVSANEGESAFDVLCETARVYDIPVEYEGTAAGGEFAYIEGIAYLYEYDYGELSGWIFLVNGETPGVGCGAYQVADGDEILWYYTRELGRDVEPDS